LKRKISIKVSTVQYHIIEYAIEKLLHFQKSFLMNDEQVGKKVLKKREKI